MKCFRLWCRRCVTWLIVMSIGWGIGHRIEFGQVQASQRSNQVTTPTESKALPMRSSVNPPGWPEGRLFLKVFGNEDGLRSGYISCLTFDQRGYLWAGTDDGAAFYR